MFRRPPISQLTYTLFPYPTLFRSILFLGGWLPPFDFAPFTWIPGPIWLFVKIALVLSCFLWVRATFPRYRYDQLMRLGWKVFLPFRSEEHTSELQSLMRISYAVFGLQIKSQITKQRGKQKAS